MSEAATDNSLGPRRVLFISSCVRGGGAGWSFYYLLKHLDRDRIAPLVLVPDQGIFRERFASLGLNVVEMPGITERSDRQRFRNVNRLTRALSLAWNVLSAIAAIPAIVRLIRRERVDIVYCNNMLVKPIGAIAAQLAGVSSALHVRNLHEKPAKIRFYGTLARLSSVRLVIANSTASAAPYRRFVPDKVHVVWNGIDLAEYRPEEIGSGELRRRLAIGTKDPVVGFTGNLIPRKGLDTLVRAAAIVVAEHPSVRFVIAGRVPIGSPVDYLARYQGRVRELGLEGHFRFPGFTPDVRPLLRDIDMLVLPSLQEPFGRSIIEAMAMEVAVIASAVGGVPEILCDGKDGLLVEPGNFEALAEAINRLLASPDLRSSLAAAARRKAVAQFDVAMLTRRIERLLVQP